MRAKKDFNWATLQEKQIKSRKVKEDLKIAELKKQEFERKKIEAAKREFDRKIAYEEKLTKQKEKEVM